MLEEKPAALDLLRNGKEYINPDYYYTLGNSRPFPK